MDISSVFTNFKLKSRLSYRILTYILLCSTLFTFISTAIQLYTEYQRDMDSVSEGLNQIRESYLNFLSLSLWDMDESQLNVQLRGALLLPDIQYLEVGEIRAAIEEVFSSAGRPGDKGAANYQFPLVYNSGQEKMHIGNLYVTVNLKGVYQRLYDRVALILTTQAISEAARKMGRLVDDLLSFSRMGRHALSFKKVVLQTLVWDVIQELEHDAAGRTINWRIGDLPAVSGDASMLRMVFGNLISNALKFTRPRQSARIEIGSMSGHDAETAICVRDNGVGFDMNYADKLFGVFQRLHRADEFEGTGIGLANERRIIARHGGRTWANGEVDQGATFCFSLPRSMQGI